MIVPDRHFFGMLDCSIPTHKEMMMLVLFLKSQIQNSIKVDYKKDLPKGS